MAKHIGDSHESFLTEYVDVFVKFELVRVTGMAELIDSYLQQNQRSGVEPSFPSVSRFSDRTHVREVKFHRTKYIVPHDVIGRRDRLSPRKHHRRRGK